MVVMVDIVFEAHSTTVDNQNHVSSGHYDVELSELGLKQSKELGERYDTEETDYWLKLRREGLRKALK